MSEFQDSVIPEIPQEPEVKKRGLIAGLWHDFLVFFCIRKPDVPPPPTVQSVTTKSLQESRLMLLHHHARKEAHDAAIAMHMKRIDRLTKDQDANPPKARGKGLQLAATKEKASG